MRNFQKDRCSLQRPSFFAKGPIKTKGSRSRGIASGSVFMRGETSLAESVGLRKEGKDPKVIYKKSGSAKRTLIPFSNFKE